MPRQESNAIERLLASRTVGYQPRSAHHRTARQRLLMLGADAGYLAPYLTTAFKITLADGSAAALERSRKLNPECRHVCTDPLALRLDETFDAILVRNALRHLTTRAALVAAFQVAHAHLSQSGAALFYLPQGPENPAPEASTGASDGGQGNVVYLEQWRKRAGQDAVRCNYGPPKSRPNGTARAVDNNVDDALFKPEKWRFLLAVAGFGTFDQVNLAGRKAFLARRG